MHTLHVELGERSYPVYIGRDLLADPQLLAGHIAGSQVVIVSNETVAPLYVERVRSALGTRLTGDRGGSAGWRAVQNPGDSG